MAINGTETSLVQGLADFKSTNEPIKHCKIVGTLGPASANEETLTKLVSEGLNITRLNFSHGDHETHARNIKLVREVAAKTGKTITILQDLQGPKIRCGKLIGDAIEIKSGETYTLKFGTEQTDPKIIPIDYKDLVRDVNKGDQVMMDDGLLLLQVEQVTGEDVKVKVLEGGTLKNRKGVNFPDSVLSLPALTEKDSKDLLFGIANGVDVVALSFVQTPEDVISCKRIIQALGADTPVIAKIEKLSAVELIDKISEVADGIMVARGDLGVEGKVEKVPAFQRRIIEAAAKHAKPVIIATQMLESMISNPRASFAEMADMANGVLEGADALMLSGEVAAGSHPVECVRTMNRAIREVEKWTRAKKSDYKLLPSNDGNLEDHQAIAVSACETAEAIDAKLIVCLSLTGSIAKTIAKWRPKTPILAISPRKDVIQRLGLIWGVYGMQNPLFYNTDKLLHDLPELLKSLGVVNTGEKIVITAGIPINNMKPTNMVKVNQIP